MKEVLVRAVTVAFGPLILGTITAYAVHYGIGALVVLFASEEKAEKILKTYKGLVVPLADLLALWALGYILWFITLS